MTRRRTLIIQAFVLLLAASQNNYAQAEAPKYEFGAQFTVLRVNDLEITEPGFGGRFTYNLTDNIAFEAEGNFFPREARVQSGLFRGFILQGGHKTQGLFGIKVGVRREKFGVFGKVRPGFVHFSRLEESTDFFFCRPPSCTPFFPPYSVTDYAVDIGGVVELYPSRRTVVRFDVGDTIIKPSSNRQVAIPVENFPTVLIIRSTSHNLQFSVGVGFRF
jgi:hypothetical protein